MNLILWVIAGALVGWIATIKPGISMIKADYFNISISIVGAMLTGYFINLLFVEPFIGLNLYSILGAIFGASASYFMWGQQTRMH